MFMSFSKTIAKVGGFRFGIRMRLTKSNALWYFLALATVYTCQLIWYSMIVCLWVMYAIAYGIFQGIRKVFRLLSKRFGKLIATAIIVGFFAFLCILGSCSNNSDGEASAASPATTETSTTEKTTANTTARENMSATDAVESWKTKSESFLVDAFDYYDIVADESGATISIATNGFAEVMETAKASGHDQNYESWANVRTSIVDMCNVFSDYAVSIGLIDYKVSIIVLDDRDYDNKILKVTSGEVSYDYMAELPDMTMGQKNALASARSYLNYSAFSYKGLIGQLEYEGYTTEEATFAADNCGADWNEQAAKKVKSYLEYSSFSRDKLIGQLEYEGFTLEQAVYGVEANGY